jgi:hypothetical protein
MLTMAEHEHKDHKPNHDDFVPKHISHSHSGGAGKKMIVMMVLVGILVLVSAVQAIELMQLKGKLGDESLTLGKASQKTSIGSSSGSSGDLSKNLESLPSMVGGC